MRLSKRDLRVEDLWHVYLHIFANVHDLSTSCSSCSTSLAVMPPMPFIRNNIEAVNNKMFVGDSVAWGAYRDPTICIIEVRAQHIVLIK